MLRCTPIHDIAVVSYPIKITMKVILDLSTFSFTPRICAHRNPKSTMFHFRESEGLLVVALLQLYLSQAIVPLTALLQPHHRPQLLTNLFRRPPFNLGWLMEPAWLDILITYILLVIFVPSLMHLGQ